MIGGNVQAVLQQEYETSANEIGEQVHDWIDVQQLCGWLDLSNGDSKYTYNTKLQESTHIFVCDYTALDVRPGGTRLLVGGQSYDVLLIDDPMGLHQQLEIYLKYVGEVQWGT